MQKAYDLHRSYAFCLKVLKHLADYNGSKYVFKPKSVVRACLDFGFWIFRRMDFVGLLMSNSELLRIKNKQKTTYKNQKTASCCKIIHKTA